MDIKVVDTYSNGAFTPEQWKNEGYSGVIFKAGQGALSDVPRIHPDWWEHAKDAGLYRGWYWLSDSRIHSSSHVLEMNRWNLFKDLGELGLWIDVEKPRISMSEREYWSTPYAGSKNVIDLLYLLNREGVKAGVYTGPGAYDLIFRNASKAEHEYMAKHNLWTAQYPWMYIPGISKPKMYGKWTTWMWWQYREGPDINIFNGNYEEFYASLNLPPTTTTGNAISLTVKLSNDKEIVLK